VKQESTARGADYNRSSRDAERRRREFYVPTTCIDVARFLEDRDGKRRLDLCITHSRARRMPAVGSHGASEHFALAPFHKSTGYEIGPLIANEAAAACQDTQRSAPRFSEGRRASRG
jgi:hypothetical protein